VFVLPLYAKNEGLKLTATQHKALRAIRASISREDRRD
jgi:hypothetical protein